MPGIDGKGTALLTFLKATATLRRKRVSAYGAGDKVLWLGDVPSGRPECRSPFLGDSGEAAELWLEVRKKRMPTRPRLPDAVTDWVRAEDLDQIERRPELLPEITVVVPEDADPPLESGSGSADQRSEVRRLNGHPEIEDAWLDYLVNKWEPWATEMGAWQQVQRVYEDLDFMRRRLEESEERYELLLAVGLLQWRDPGGTTVKRHVLTAPAEINLDAGRGVLTLVPAASFDRFRVELDMLELQHQPRLDEDAIAGRLDELDIQAWDAAKVGQVLREIGNRLPPDAQLDEATMMPAERSAEVPHLSYAPAIVLCERRPHAYEDLIRKFLTNSGASEGVLWPAPWRTLLGEGDPGGDARGGEVGPDGTDACVAEPVRYLFPLPANDEQRQIVSRLEAEPCVLVKGPPGTGKSHTIANLICHLLASGDRVLVTAQAAKALAVLRRLLPDDARDLCVTSLGSSRDDQRLLEESVRGILRRKNDWRGSLWADRAIEEMERDLQQCEGDRVKVERRLREYREAEVHSHTLPGGYAGTAGQIARILNEQREQFAWFPSGVAVDTPFPLEPAELAFLAEMHGRRTAEKLEELRLEIGKEEFPDGEVFCGLVDSLSRAEQAVGRAKDTASVEKIDALGAMSAEEIQKFCSGLTALEEHAVRAARTLGDVAGIIIGDHVLGDGGKWSRLASEAGIAVDRIEALRKRLGTTRVDAPNDVPRDQLRHDAERRWAHFEAGGRRGLSLFAPQVVKETRYLEERCLVDGQRPQQPDLLKKLVETLELADAIDAFEQAWPVAVPSAPEPARATRASDLVVELRRLLQCLETLPPGWIACVPASSRVALALPSERLGWVRATEAESASRNTQALSDSYQEILNKLRRCQATGGAHPCIEQLAHAAESRDTRGWQIAWQQRERLKAEHDRLEQYTAIVDKLEMACRGMSEWFASTPGTADWAHKLQDLDKAWAWSSATRWLRRVSDPSAYADSVCDFHRLQERLEKVTEQLVSVRAWRSFLDERLDERTVQSLHAWTRAVDRIGRGTGRHAYRHRRAARQYLLDCVPRIPAWIMPLHKLWDSVDAQPGMFDTIIIDEASQAGIDALALFLLGKRLIVVGDDKQNSPEAVGVLEDDVARLARDYLSDFRFRDEYRPDTSLFDHAERSFGSFVSLREHFRCVPEIIRFSNDLCYRDAPLIPLRQAPPNRLVPIRPRFVPEGACEGEGQRIRNRAEAEAVVEVVASVLADDTYENKTIGVIALQGHAQAELIERMLAQRLDPKTLQERRLRCGEPASFQGDQRDVIVLSLVIAPNVRYRALSRLPDQRRFNVAMSRAKDQVWLVYSVHQHDLSPEDLRRRLVSFFESPGRGELDRLTEDLDRLEREARGTRRRGYQPEPYESWFEVDVALELLRQRYAVRPQFEVASKRIDLVVEGIDARLAVECDGDEWHGPEQYERDMARQRQLERAGWTFVRVRGSDFYANRHSVTQTVIDACEALGVYPLDRIQETGALPTAATEESPPPVVAGIEEEPATDDKSEEEVSETQEQSGPFAGYTKASGFPDPREASSANIRTVLRQIIEREGPLARPSIYRLYVEGCPDLQRVGKAVRQSLNRALGAMLRAGEIVQEDELKDGSPEGHVVRLAGTGKVQVRAAGRRDVPEIPPSELLAVLTRLFPDRSGRDENEVLLRGLLEHYGFSRLTRPRREYLAKILRFWCA